MLKRILLYGIMALGLPSTILAEEGAAGDLPNGVDSSVAVGSRVRVTWREIGAPRLVGEVVAVEPGALVVVGENGDRQRVALRSAFNLEVSTGRKSSAGRGAMIGGAIGGLSGILTNIGDYNTNHHTLAISVAGAASGAAIGALVGLAVKTEGWRPVRGPSVSAAIAPVPRGAAVSVSVTWGGAAP